MRVLLVGDTHGSRRAIKDSFDLAADTHCDRIFQLGDFGFDPKSKYGNAYLAWCNKHVKDDGIPFYFLAGNHENWNDLDYVFATYLTDEDGFHKYGNLRVAPRSNIWTWDGMRFANMSGAFSIDRKYRTLGLTWFEQELPTQHDIDALSELKELKKIDKVDVMLAHDAPVNLFEHQGKHNMVFHHPDASIAQDYMGLAIDTVEPYCLIHGHWHMFYQYFYHDVFCLALEQLTTPAHTVQFAIIDTHERTLSTYTSQEDVAFEIP